MMNKEDVLVVCRSRTSSQTYEKFKRIYTHAKLNGLTDVNVHFIEPEADKLRDKINKLTSFIKYFKRDFRHKSEFVKALEKLEEILEGDSNE